MTLSSPVPTRSRPEEDAIALHMTCEELSIRPDNTVSGRVIISGKGNDGVSRSGTLTVSGLIEEAASLMDLNEILDTTFNRHNVYYAFHMEGVNSLLRWVISCILCIVLGLLAGPLLRSLWKTLHAAKRVSVRKTK